VFDARGNLFSHLIYGVFAIIDEAVHFLCGKAEMSYSGDWSEQSPGNEVSHRPTMHLKRLGDLTERESCRQTDRRLRGVGLVLQTQASHIFIRLF